MRERYFNNNWTFCKTKLGAEKPDIINPVCLPHDWLIYDGKDLYQDSIGWYRRIINTDELKGHDLNYQNGDRVILYFDGVYMDTTIYMNGIEIFQWKYGYSAFYVDITEHISDGDNEIIVKVVHQSPNSRWYSGAGIFRDVKIRVMNKTYMPYNATYVSIKTTDKVDEFSIYAETEVVIDNAKHNDINDISIKYELLDNGNVLKDLGLHKISEIKSDDDNVTYKAKLNNTVSSPHLWDIDDPYCYKLRVSLLDGNNVLDYEDITVGFRTVEFTENDGFYLNGRRLKLNGVCEHHDLGCLGSAFSRDAMIRKISILKEMGVNSIRTSHNMPAKELMDLADEMGILILSEAFDMWARPKTEFDYARFFNDWVDRDVESWIKRDRNHPSVFMWSIGNEIYDTHAGEEGYLITKKLMDLVKKYDPMSNARITLGSNYMPWENTQKCADLYKLVGYNYTARYYRDHHEKYPDWVIYGSETASVVMSRGVYHFPFSQPVMSDEDEQCSALGNSTTSWGAKSVEHCINDDRREPFSLGQYLWTGFDYIGEPTPYHTRNSYFGQIDTAGFPKDAYYVYKAEWTDVNKDPMVHLFPYWDFNNGQIVDVRACSNGSEIELVVNDKSYGRKKLDHVSDGIDFTATWQVPYEPGYIGAIAYDEDGNIIAEDVHYSFRDSKKIVLRAKQYSVNNTEPNDELSNIVMPADGRSLLFVEISTVDEEGHPVENAMDYVRVSVDGPAYLVGLDNGDSTDYDEYKGNIRKLFNGKLLAVIRAGVNPGKATVKVSNPYLGEETIDIIVNSDSGCKGCCSECTTNITANASYIPGLEFEKRHIANISERKFDRIPARKVELTCEGSSLLNADNKEVYVSAKLYPLNTTDTDIVFKAVNDAGIEINYVNLMRDDADSNRIKVEALGDGEFWLRAMSKDGEGKIRLISQLKFSVTGLGTAYLNPYEFVTGGLYTKAFGDIGNGNEKGFATSSDGVSAAMFENIDFGEIGSDTVVIPAFCLSNDGYQFKIYEGSPEDGDVVFDGVCQQNYIWNVYQDDTYVLNRRLKGVTSLSIEFYNKVHIKGFTFKKYEKAFEELNASMCSSVYGDQFVKEKDAITNIGNNVTIEFEDMNFGDEGADSITIYGKTPLENNSIHLHITDEMGNETNQIMEFNGKENVQTFKLDKITGNCKISFVFLPGSSFDFEKFRFFKL